MKKYTYRIVDDETLQDIKYIQSEAELVFFTKKQIKIILYTLGSIFLLSILFLLGYHKYNENFLTKEIERLETINVNTKHIIDLEYQAGKSIIRGSHKIPTDSIYKIYEFAKKCGAWYPEVIYAQCILESSSGTSLLAKEVNNLFGMKQVHTRLTTQIKGKNYKGYGVYINWECSVIDRILWEEWRFSGVKPNRDKYLNIILAKNGYAEDPFYKDKILNLIKDLNLE